MEKIARECKTQISISVVSHAQITLIENLLYDIDEHCQTSPIELVLTLNLEETVPFATDSFSFPIKVIRNSSPQGFAANHNQAFAHAAGRFFCVMNPDIRLGKDPFPALLSCLQHPDVGVAAPIIVGESGAMEDSARRFPTPLKILCKAFGGCKGSDYVIGDVPINPDWAGGMFLLFPRGIFEKLGGFDQRYFLYYEDVDICARLRLLGYEVLVCPQERVIHQAQRSSHRNMKYLLWHLRSMTRFFFSPVFWRLMSRKLSRKGQGIC